MNHGTIRIGLTFDLRDEYLKAGYSEDETAEFDRAETIDAIESTLQSLGYETDRIGNIGQLTRRLVDGDRWDLVFNICEGMYGIGREAQVPALLDAYQIPYTFSDALVCALTLHKGMTKDVVRAAGVATPDYAIVRELADIKNITLPMPLFAKPVAEGTGKGITAQSKVNNVAELRQICRKLLRDYKGQPVLVERFLPGREFTVGIVGTGRDASAVATMEIVLLQGADPEVYSYHNKENCEELVRYDLLPASKLRRSIESCALRAWRALGCRDGGRIDIRLDQNGVANFLEVNPLAGIHPEHSDLPIMSTMVGLSYQSLIHRIVSSALTRCRIAVRTDSLAAA